MLGPGHGIAGDNPQPVSDEFACAGDQSDDGGGRPEGGQIGADDAAGAFVHHVGKQAHHAEDEDKVPGLEWSAGHAPIVHGTEAEVSPMS